MVIRVLMIAFVIVLTSACVKKHSGKVLIKFTNKTEMKINDFVVNEQKVGNINRNETSNYQLLESIELDGEQVMVTASAKIDGQKINNLTLYCGTMLHELPEGKYTMGIDVIHVDISKKLRITLLK